MVSMCFRWRRVLEWIWSGFLWWCWPSRRGVNRSSTWASFPPGRWCLTSRAACSCLIEDTVYTEGGTYTWLRPYFYIRGVRGRPSEDAELLTVTEWMVENILYIKALDVDERLPEFTPNVTHPYALFSVAIHLHYLLERFVHQSLLKSHRVSNMLLSNVT